MVWRDCDCALRNEQKRMEKIKGAVSFPAELYISLISFFKRKGWKYVCIVGSSVALYPFSLHDHDFVTIFSHAYFNKIVQCPYIWRVH
jgi:hypothetical protein